jgi:hypothetical protein
MSHLFFLNQFLADGVDIGDHGIVENGEVFPEVEEWLSNLLDTDINSFQLTEKR